jgi:hypothetical protein
MPTPVIPGRGGRPLPPTSLSPREKEIWTACVESRPVGYFTAEIFPLVAAYAMHAIQAENIAVQLREKSTEKLRRLYRQETMAICTLSSKLRLAKMQRRQHQTSEEREASCAPRRRLWTVHTNTTDG